MTKRKKRFDGVLFTYAGNSRTKSMAINMKDTHKDNGYKVRIVKVRAKSYTKFAGNPKKSVLKGFSYDVYINK